MLSTLLKRAERTRYGSGVAARCFVMYARTGCKADVQERAAEDKRIELQAPATLLGLGGTASS